MVDTQLCRLKIQLGDVAIEIEGDKAFVETKFHSCLEFVESRALVSDGTKRRALDKAPKGALSKSRKDSTQRRNGKKASAPVVLDLDVDTKELKSFYDEKQPLSHESRYLVFSFFLSERLQMEEVDTHEVYTCYRLLGIRAPKHIKQPFYDAKHRHSWFDAGDEPGKFRITHIGKEHVRYNLPAEKSKEPRP